MNNNTMNRIAAYNALIAEVCNRSAKLDYAFFADDATCTLTMMTACRALEIVCRYEGGYVLESKYYDVPEAVLDAAAEYTSIDELAAFDDVVTSYIDAHEDEEDPDLV